LLANEDVALLKRTILKAGRLAMDMLARGVKQWSKPDGSLVTEADLAVDELLRTELMAERPDYGWLSEETPDDLKRLEAERCWVADPIDGTRSFARGGDSWCVGVALTERGRPIAASVYHPQLGRLYWASLGQGCFHNDSRLSVADKSDLDEARIMGSKTLTKPLEKHGAITVPSNDTPLLARLAMLASGELDGVVSLGPKADWDLAAGELLVTEAGGVVSGLGGEQLDYNRRERQQPGLVAAAPARHKLMLDVLSKHAQER
jgi:myo-inositol-1(or 4)-monophosphatase